MQKLDSNRVWKFSAPDHPEFDATVKRIAGIVAAVANHGLS